MKILRPLPPRNSFIPNNVGPEVPKAERGEGTTTRSPLHQLLTILAGALILLWPALLNRYPLLYPDSVNYLGDGPQVAQALLHFQYGELGWMRSPLYALGIAAVHWHRFAWPIVVLHALITAWILWLVTRSLLRRAVIASYLTITALLSALTGLSWVVCWLLPDILGAICYLCLYLLIFAREKLSRNEAITVYALLVWTATSHVTHLILAIGLCLWLGMLRLLWPSVMRQRNHALLRTVALIAVAVALQIAANGFLTGSATLTGRHPPFITARLLGDGPARTLLAARCGQLRFTLCRFRDQLPTDSDEFLWGDGIMTRASPEQQAQIVREEMPLLAATLRAYPTQQLRISLHNFRMQLTYYDIEGFGNNTWAEHTLDTVLPGAGVPYHRSRQLHNTVPSDVFSDIQDWIIPLSVVALVALIPLCWRRHHKHLLALSVIIIPVIIANAFLTGVLSVADSRYQVRIVWLLPFLALLMLCKLVEARSEPAA